MGTIVRRKRKDKSTAFMAQIMKRHNGQAIRETKTFDKRSAAAEWVERREAEIDRGEIGGRNLTLAAVISLYVESSRREIGRTKAQVLRSIGASWIGQRRCEDITSAEIVRYAQGLSNGRQPQTVANYLSHLGAVASVAGPAWGAPLDPQAIKGAAAVCKRLGLTSKTRERSRRPTVDEMQRLMNLFRKREATRNGVVPMSSVVVFALYSTRRLEEITRLDWSDFKDGRIIVRDMKHPGDKSGNHVVCDLPKEAIDIIKVFERDSGRIFPYHPDTIGRHFTSACKTLGIDDLHFHDLRHEGISRLFEIGWNIPHVAAVSGHRTWTSLKRYTHLRQDGDKWENTTWLANIYAAPTACI